MNYEVNDRLKANLERRKKISEMRSTLLEAEREYLSQLTTGEKAEYWRSRNEEREAIDRETEVLAGMKGEVIRDPSVKDEDIWRVVWDGKIQSASFQSKGAAEVQLSLIRLGIRKPE